MKIVPLYDRVLVERIKSTNVTEGGIIIPDVAKEKPLEGVVVAVGKGKVLDNGILLTLELHVGDRIFFGKYSGFEMSIDGKEYIMMRDNDVLCKINQEGVNKCF